MHGYLTGLLPSIGWPRKVKQFFIEELQSYRKILNIYIIDPIYWEA